MSLTESKITIESAVHDRYSRAAREPERALCCPDTASKQAIDFIPAEVLERDYGCGDPTTHLKAGETVLDLGSGAGKACFLAAKTVGAAGRSSRTSSPTRTSPNTYSAIRSCGAAASPAATGRIGSWRRSRRLPSMGSRWSTGSPIPGARSRGSSSGA